MGHYSASHLITRHREQHSTENSTAQHSTAQRTAQHSTAQREYKGEARASARQWEAKGQSKRGSQLLTRCESNPSVVVLHFGTFCPAKWTESRYLWFLDLQVPPGILSTGQMNECFPTAWEFPHITATLFGLLHMRLPVLTFHPCPS
jgi:hypothetical protein